MRTAKDIMTTSVITIRPEADVTEAARLLLDKQINGLPVVDGVTSAVCLAEALVKSGLKTSKIGGYRK